MMQARRTPCHNLRPSAAIRHKCWSQISKYLGSSQIAHRKSLTLNENSHLGKLASTRTTDSRLAAARRHPANEGSVLQNGAGQVPSSAFRPADGADPGGKTMEANDFRLSELFGNHVFSLFKAQPPYLWDEEHALKLLEDFLGQIEDDSTPIK